jgi:hypothetical protein
MPVRPAAERRRSWLRTMKSSELCARPTLASIDVVAFRMPVVESIQFSPGSWCRVCIVSRLLLPAPAHWVP